MLTLGRFIRAKSISDAWYRGLNLIWRQGGGITGSVVLPIKPGHAIEEIRKAYQALLAAHPDWDQRTGQLQVSEARVGSVELKLVMSALGPSELARLRSAMREAMLDWLREHCPEALCTAV